MDAYEAVQQAATAGGISLAGIGRAMSRPPNYVSNGAARGSTPKADTLAAMLAPCGYVLAALPRQDAPASALVIDPRQD